MTTRLYSALFRVGRDLDDLGVGWAVVGGLAIGFRGAPRFTGDVDFAVAVESDRQAEQLIFELRQRGYEIREDTILEQTATGRLSTVRLMLSDASVKGVTVDLLFASSGIEPEIVEMASPVEVEPGTRVPVASVGDLLALKVLAGRQQDEWDFRRLLSVATTADLERARQAIEAIERRGFNREKRLRSELERLVSLGAEPGLQ